MAKAAKKNNKSIIEIINGKRALISNGAAIHSDPTDVERLAFSPKTGMTLKVRGKKIHKELRSPYQVTKFNKNGKGEYQGKAVDTKEYTVRWVYFDLDQTIKKTKGGKGVVPAIDPATGDKVVVFPASFRQKFMKTPFVEMAPNLLVSRPISLTKEDVIAGGQMASLLPLSVVITVALYQNKKVDKNTYFVTTAYWSDDYSGRYCYE